MIKSVLYICPNGYIGGAESFVFNICEAHLKQKKFKPHILFFSSGPGVSQAQKLGIDHTVLDQPFKLSNINFIKASFKIRKIIKSLSPDIIHFTMPYSVVACFFALINIKVKKVWFQHGPVSGRLDYIASFLPVDAIFFNSTDTMQRHFSQCRNLYHAKIQVVKLGIKKSSLPNPILKNEEKKKVILNVGRISELKGIHLLIEALAILKNEMTNLQSFVHCLIIGSANSKKDQNYYAKLHTLTKQHQLENIIEFIPHKDNIQDAYQKADILVQASVEAEAFGLVVAEAMSEKLFVIGPKLGGIQDILKDKITGLTFNSNADKAEIELAEKLKLVLNDQVETETIKNNAFNLISNDYSLEAMTQNIERIYLSFS